jgi:catechol 2,3-dioxygenase-like lactoylglutathione lyase family enzyme
MDPQLSFVTLGVPDLAAARRFYVDGLGWEPTFEVDGEVVFIQIGHGLLLSLWRAEALAEDMGEAPAAARGAGLTLAHNVGSDAQVEAAVARVVAAGGRVVREARQAFFGGLQAYVADPAGFVWEIAHNPGWGVDADGRVHIGPP